ncbi:nuclear transport factor 2 family protein [Stenotrophomonas sp. CFBP8980]|uniref:nuclear transport factor 2 family protein n=1 Tax=Stenotrophomonas sp. CFBP8980 TaxID=3096523 RepID=UPI002A6B5E49|nr:nuclear transport factor 2 family protein [Stenotrophomonas sp. CFBP8980]MDY1032033.1 nuclear transport factor 2 family protein [Stenotrophomonas sp. CFBP8980]
MDTAAGRVSALSFPRNGKENHVNRSTPNNRLALVLTLAIAALSSAHASTPEPVHATAAHNEALVRRAFTNWSTGNGTVFALLSPDVVWTVHGSGTVAGTYEGVEAFLEGAAAPLTRRLARPLVPKLHAIWAVGDTVISRFEAESTTTGGRPYTNQYVWIFRMEDGVVVEAEAFLDLVAYDKVVAENTAR